MANWFLFKKFVRSWIESCYVELTISKKKKVSLTKSNCPRTRHFLTVEHANDFVDLKNFNGRCHRRPQHHRNRQQKWLRLLLCSRLSCLTKVFQLKRWFRLVRISSLLFPSCLIVVSFEFLFCLPRSKFFQDFRLTCRQVSLSAQLFIATRSAIQIFWGKTVFKFTSQHSTADASFQFSIVDLLISY